MVLGLLVSLKKGRFSWITWVGSMSLKRKREEIKESERDVIY